MEMEALPVPVSPSVTAPARTRPPWKMLRLPLPLEDGSPELVPISDGVGPDVQPRGGAADADRAGGASKAASGQRGDTAGEPGAVHDDGAADADVEIADARFGDGAD